MQLTSPGRDNPEHHDYYTHPKGYDLLYPKQKTIDPNFVQRKIGLNCMTK